MASMAKKPVMVTALYPQPGSEREILARWILARLPPPSTMAKAASTSKVMDRLSLSWSKGGWGMKASNSMMTPTTKVISNGICRRIGAS